MNAKMQHDPPRRVGSSKLEGPADLVENENSDRQGHLVLDPASFAEFCLDPCVLIVVRPQDRSAPIICGHFARAPFMEESLRSFFAEAASIAPDPSKCRVDCFGVSDVNESQWSTDEWNAETIRNFVEQTLNTRGYTNMHCSWPAPGKYQDVIVNGFRRTITYSEYRE